MTLNKRITCFCIVNLIIGSFFSQISIAQYYPPPGTYNPMPGYDPYASQPGGYNTSTNPYGYYGTPGQSYPPATQSYGYPPPATAPYSAAPGTPPSPFTSTEAASFNSNPSYIPGTPPPATTAYPPTATYYGQPAYGAPTATPGLGTTPSPNGFKFSYVSQAGDYLNLQSRNNGRWEQFPVSLHLTFPEDMSDKDKEIVRSAVAGWQKYLDISLVDQPDLAKIELTWVTNLTDNEDLGETEVVASHMDPMGRNIMDKVIVRVQDPSKYPLDVYPGILKSIVTHQLGHALGINSHSDNDKDLMAEPSYRKPKNKIVQKAVRSLASRTLGQLIDLSSYDNNQETRRATYPPTDKIGKRDLNTLLRLYN